MIDLSMLNPEQHAAVTAPLGPVLVVAGPGAAKTRVLGKRIAFILDTYRQVLPWKLLAVTFTRKAADQMVERLKQEIGETRANQVKTYTFHALGSRILWAEIGRLGFPNVDSNYTIVDDKKGPRIIQNILEGLGLEEKLSVELVGAQISRAKSGLLTPEEYAKIARNAEEFEFCEIYSRYEDALCQNNQVDFDDLIYLTVRIFMQFPEAAANWASKFDYVAVNEFQDTDQIEFLLLKALTLHKRNAFVVGDEDQSIYGWRGADSRIMSQFKAEYRAQLGVLNRNYRSKSRILEVAGASIRNNPDRLKQVALEPVRGEGGEVTFHKLETDLDEAAMVASEIQRLTRSGQVAPSGVAILYRVNAAGRAFEEELVRRGINYMVVGSSRFYERKEILDLLAYLKVLVTPEDAEATERMINTPNRGLGKVSQVALAERAQAEGISVIHLIVAIALGMTDAPRAGSVQRSRLIHLGKSYQRWLKMMDEHQSSAGILRQIVDDIGYQSFLTDGSEAGLMRWENVEELIGVAGQHPNVKAFLDHVGRMSDPRQRADGSAVQLITIHAAKGLEFDTVFLVRCEEGCLPHYRSVGHPGLVQEEWRLFYVGVTRAENRLYLSFPASRSFRGGEKEQTPSRFFREVETVLSAPVNPILASA